MSHLDSGSGGPDNDFTNRTTTFMTYNLLHLGAMLRAVGGVPSYGNDVANGMPAVQRTRTTRSTDSHHGKE